MTRAGQIGMHLHRAAALLGAAEAQLRRSDKSVGRITPAGVNARVILHQRAGAKMHQRREQEGPQLGALVYSWFNLEACRQMALTAFDALNGRDDSCRRSFPGYGRDG